MFFFNPYYDGLILHDNGTVKILDPQKEIPANQLLNCFAMIHVAST